MNKLWLPSRRSLIQGAGAAVIASPINGANLTPRIALMVGKTNPLNSTAYANFATGNYGSSSLTALFSNSRASTATSLLPTSASGAGYTIFGNNQLAVVPGVGLLIYPQATNLLINSDITTSTGPATQTTSSLGTGTYTLWVNGSGSALASGGTATITGAASATNGSPNTFTVTVAGTVTVTVTGSLNQFQLEAGSAGTSFVPTLSVTATRLGDNISCLSLPASALQSPNYSVFAAYTSYAPAGGAQYIYDGGTGIGMTGIYDNGTGFIIHANSAGTLVTLAGATKGVPHKIAVSFSIGSPAESGVTDAPSSGSATTAITQNSGTSFIGGPNGSQTLQGVLSRIIMFNSLQSISALLANG